MKKNSASYSSGQKGFSLIEVLVATMLVGLILTAVATLMTLTIKNAAQARYREAATKLAQEGMEFFNREDAVLVWSNFAGYFPVGSNTYCLATLPGAGQLQAINTGSCSASETIQENGGEYIRQATVTKTAAAATQINVVIIVSWVDGARTSTVNITKYFQKLVN